MQALPKRQEGGEVREEGEGGRKERDMERERRGGDESNASQETVWDAVPYQSILATHCGLPARLQSKACVM